MPAKQVFTFKDGKYTIDSLRTVVKGSPKICIKASDLDPSFRDAIQLPAGHDDSQELIALYPYGDKYFVLQGLNKVIDLLTPKKNSQGLEVRIEPDEINIAGYLVTKHTLKKARVPDPSEQVVNEGVQDFSMGARAHYGERGRYGNTPYQRENQTRGGQRRW